jgi:hypothetical protein
MPFVQVTSPGGGSGPTPPALERTWYSVDAESAVPLYHETVFTAEPVGPALPSGWLAYDPLSIGSFAVEESGLRLDTDGNGCNGVYLDNVDPNVDHTVYFRVVPSYALASTGAMASSNSPIYSGLAYFADPTDGAQPLALVGYEREFAGGNSLLFTFAEWANPATQFASGLLNPNSSLFGAPQSVLASYRRVRYIASSRATVAEASFDGMLWWATGAAATLPFVPTSVGFIINRANETGERTARFPYLKVVSGASANETITPGRRVPQ